MVNLISGNFISSIGTLFSIRTAGEKFQFEKKKKYENFSISVFSPQILEQIALAAQLRQQHQLGGIVASGTMAHNVHNVLVSTDHRFHHFDFVQKFFHFCAHSATVTVIWLKEKR